MELSRLIARIIAVIYVAGGIGTLTGKVNFRKIAENLERSPALTFIAGSLGIIAGLILVEYHNIWIRNWTVFITAYSWLLLTGGLITVVIPELIWYFGRNYYKDSPVWGIFMIAFGLLFGYFGFIN